MNVNRILLFNNGNAVNRLREFLSSWWQQVGLGAMLAPTELSGTSGVVSQPIEDPAGLANVNPFAPIMVNNTAAMIEEFLKDHLTGRLAIILRPCEFRTLVELQKRHRIMLNSNKKGGESDANVVILGVDCPGTFPAAEYTRRINLSGSDSVIREALSYGAEGGYTPGQLRAACHICEWPAPRGADITIGSIGAAPHQYLLVIARDEIIDEQWGLQASTDGVACEEWVVRRETAVGAVADVRAIQRSRLTSASVQSVGDFGSLLAFFARCTLCTDCLDACPLYNGELSSMLGVCGSLQPKRPLLSELVLVGRWLASCSGCGMCQEACEQGAAIAPLIAALSMRIREELHYTAGDPTKGLPWMIMNPTR